MKRIFLLLLISIVFHFNALSQYSKGKFYMGVNYRYCNHNSLVDGIGSKDISSTFAPTIGYLITNNFVVGCGFNYEYRDASKITQGMTGTVNGVLFDDEHLTKSNTIRGFAPSIFARYICPITKNLSVSMMLKSSSGSLKQEVYQQYVNVVNGSRNPYNSFTAKGTYTDVSVSPELRYLFTSKIGLQVNFNGYLYSSHPKENNVFDYDIYKGYVVKKPIIYEKLSGVNFSPSNWSYGVFIIL